MSNSRWVYVLREDLATVEALQAERDKCREAAVKLRRELREAWDTFSLTGFYPERVRTVLRDTAWLDKPGEGGDD